MTSLMISETSYYYIEVMNPEQRAVYTRDRCISGTLLKLDDSAVTIMVPRIKEIYL